MKRQSLALYTLLANYQIFTSDTTAQRPAPGLIVHSDRGGQCVGKNYKTLLRNAKVQLSHSCRGDYYHNAQTESR